jgi:PAS domain S-box-containing protein
MKEEEGYDTSPAYLDYLDSYEELYQQAPCGYISHLPDGTIVRINDTLCRWLGCSRDGVTGKKKITDFFDFGGKIFYQTHHYPLLKLQGYVSELSYNLLTADEGTLPVLISAITKKDERGNIVVVQATIFDITERKKYERELLNARKKAEEAERRFRFMAESIPAYVWTMEPNGEMDYYSRKFYDCTGKDFGDDAVSREDWGALLHPRDRQKTYQALDYALKTGEEYKIDHRISNKNGGYTWMQSRAVPYRDESGKIVKWFGATIDIQEDIESREVIRKTQSQFQLVMNTIPALVSYVDADFRYVLANRMYSEWFGRKADEVEGMHVMDVVGAEDYKFLKPYMDRALQGESVTFEHVLENAHAGRRVLKVTYNPDSDDEQVNGFVIFVSDITKEKEFEQTLENLVRERTQKLEQTNIELLESNRDLEQFAYVASHDLKEPLRMISNYTQLILRKIENENEEIHEYSGYVTEGVDRMRHMIDDLLAYSRLERTDLTLHPVDMNKVIEEVLNHLADTIIEKEAFIEVGVLPVVRSSRTLMGHLFQNLLTNALKFMRPDVKPKIEINAEEEETDWLFSVADNGIGINQEYAGKVFQIFQRLHGRDQYEGTGIGLALCKRIIEIHNGKIWFEPNGEDGTVFKFSIPKE